MKFSAKVVGTDPVAQQAAAAYLEAGGDAVGAAVCGFFAAAGEYPEVLLGPAVLMLARVGVGVRAFDGRCRQPGMGLRRRKGYHSVQQAPDAARVAVPTGLTALLVALRYGQGTGLSKVVAPGVAIAQRNGAEKRAEVLDAVQRLGASALYDPLLHRSLVHRGGPTEGGMLTVDDLRAIPRVDYVAASQGRSHQLPWQTGEDSELPAEAPSNGDREGNETAPVEELPALAVMDSGGGLVLVGYSRQAAGLHVPELELTLPLHGVPLQKGIARIAPGTVLLWNRHMDLEIDDNGSPARGSVSLGAGKTLPIKAAEADSWGVAAS